MALTADEKKLLEDLTKKSQEEDPDETFEIEVYDTANGRGARIPYSQGKQWLWENLGLGSNPNPPAEPGEGDKSSTVKTGYFGRQQGKASQKEDPKAS